MPKFVKLLTKEQNGFKVNLYEFDINDDKNFEKLKQYLITKIRSMKVHNNKEFDLNFYSSPNLDNEFIAQLNNQISNINTPKVHGIKHFDVRRERVTEWIGQLLLEKNFNCIFYDEADKKININPVNVDKHTPGVDVPGIRLVDNQLKFVICEVKASDSVKIPCSSSKDLNQDIGKGYYNEDNRVSKEILNYMQGVKNVSFKDDLLGKIIDFLTKLLKESSSLKALIESIVFFPLIIRNNSEICSELNDFNNFCIDNFKGINLESISLSFGTDITDFSNDIYDRAIKNE